MEHNEYIKLQKDKIKKHQENITRREYVENSYQQWKDELGPEGYKQFKDEFKKEVIEWTREQNKNSEEWLNAQNSETTETPKPTVGNTGTQCL